MIRSRLRFAAAALAIVALAAAAPAQGAFGKDDVRVHVLKNGLKVLLVEDHDIPNVALYTFFRVGSRNERPGLTGVSHFIEHMMFNGTEAYGPGEFDRTMEFRGGSNNAYTADDMTAYTDWFPAAALEHMIAMEADRMQGLIFDPEVFESERGVVASERRAGVENNHDAILRENVRATAIMAHPYHWTVIGWMSDILSWPRDEVMAYYRTYYAPNNAVLVLVGDFAGDEALRLIETHYGPIPSGPPAPAVRTEEPPQLGPKEVVIRRDVQTPSLLLVWHAPAVSDPDHIPLSVLAMPLLDGDSSRLHRRLVRDEQLALSVSGGIQETVDPYLFSIFVKARPGADLDRIKAVIEEELAKIRIEGLTPAELEKAMNMVRADYHRGLQTIAGKANALGRAELIHGDFAALFGLVERYRAVTNAAIRDAAAEYFTDSGRTVGRLVPAGGEK